MRCFSSFHTKYVELLFERGPRVVTLLSKDLSSIGGAVAPATTPCFARLFHWFVLMLPFTEVPTPRPCIKLPSVNLRGGYGLGLQKIQTHFREGTVVPFRPGPAAFDGHHVHAQSLRNAVLVCWARKKNLQWEIERLWCLFIGGYILLILAFVVRDVRVRCLGRKSLWSVFTVLFLYKNI